MNAHELDMLLESRRRVIGGRLGRWLCRHGWHHLMSAYPLRGQVCRRCKHFTKP